MVIFRVGSFHPVCHGTECHTRRAVFSSHNLWPSMNKPPHPWFSKMLRVPSVVCDEFHQRFVNHEWESCLGAEKEPHSNTSLLCFKAFGPKEFSCAAFPSGLPTVASPVTFFPLLSSPHLRPAKIPLPSSSLQMEIP